MRVNRRKVFKWPEPDIDDGDTFAHVWNRSQAELQTLAAMLLCEPDGYPSRRWEEVYRPEWRPFQMAKHSKPLSGNSRQRRINLRSRYDR